MSSHKSTLPKAVVDIKRQVEKICGKPVEPGVLERLIDFQYEYVSQSILDARQVTQYLGKKEVDLDDLKLAHEMSEKESSSHPRPTKQLLGKIAQKINEVPLTKVNEIPLPPAKPVFGLRIPPDRFCTTACNFQTEDVADMVDATHSNGSI